MCPTRLKRVSTQPPVASATANAADTQITILFFLFMVLLVVLVLQQNAIRLFSLLSLRPVAVVAEYLAVGKFGLAAFAPRLDMVGVHFLQCELLTAERTDTFLLLRYRKRRRCKSPSEYRGKRPRKMTSDQLQARRIAGHHGQDTPSRLIVSQNIS